jgi:REase_DpnII-MboI
MPKIESNLSEDLIDRIQKGTRLLERQIRSDDDLRSAILEYEEWDSYNWSLLASRVSTEQLAAEYKTLSPVTWDTTSLPLPVRVSHFRERVNGKIAALKSFQGRLSLLEFPTVLPSSTQLELLRSFLRRFHAVGRQLSIRREGRPTLTLNDEYDVQDLLQSLLILLFDDVRREEWTPSYAASRRGSTSSCPKEESS